MDNILAKKFTFTSLLSFALPNIMMMISLSMYIIIDGMFVSRFIGTTALSAVNMFYPAICFEMAAAIMIATGGSAVAARKLGEGKQKEAQSNLTALYFGYSNGIAPIISYKYGKIGRAHV